MAPRIGWNWAFEPMAARPLSPRSPRDSQYPRRLTRFMPRSRRWAMARSRAQKFWMGRTIYVDAVQPPTAPAENGTIFRPFNTVTEAVSSVVSGGRISIVEGNYAKAAGNTMIMGADGKSFTLLAPVGTVTIGN